MQRQFKIIDLVLEMSVEPLRTLRGRILRKAGLFIIPRISLFQ